MDTVLGGLILLFVVMVYGPKGALPPQARHVVEIVAAWFPFVALPVWVVVKRKWLAKWQRVEGEVIEMQRSKRTWKPVIRFQTTEGFDVVYASQSGSSPPRYLVGQRVPILYNPDDPQEATIPHLLQTWGAEIIIGILLTGGVAFAAVAAHFAH